MRLNGWRSEVFLAKTLNIECYSLCLSSLNQPACKFSSNKSFSSCQNKSQLYVFSKSEKFKLSAIQSHRSEMELLGPHLWNSKNEWSLKIHYFIGFNIIWNNLWSTYIYCLNRPYNNVMCSVRLCLYTKWCTAYKSLKGISCKIIHSNVCVSRVYLWLMLVWAICQTAQKNRAH